jgi:nucleoside-diphosphate-sugar epimerase
MAQALVAGGSGFFGGVLVRQLLRRGYSVRILDLNPPVDSKVEFIRGDICKEEIVRSACTNVDVVHHNVAQVPLAKNKELFWRVNRDGTQILLNAALKAGVRKVVYTSSSAVFGVPERNPVTRAAELNKQKVPKPRPRSIRSLVHSG